MPKLKLPRFFNGQSHREQIFGKLKLLDCPHCGQSDNLIRNGLLYGNDPAQQGIDQIERGQRVRCSNRGTHCGCGRSFAIYKPETLPSRSVHPDYLMTLLKVILKHAGCVHHAWQQSTRWFSLSTAYRLWKAFQDNQSQLRHRLCGYADPPACSYREPIMQVIEHLCAVFKVDPIQTYHKNFQEPILPDYRVHEPSPAPM